MSQPTLLFIHGWATNAQIWQYCYGNSNIHYYDAPHFPDFIHLSKVLNSTVKQFSSPLTIVGWSLGGMLALQLAASQPEKIKKLVLVSSTPRFTSCHTYSAGLSPALVKRLAKKIYQDKWQTQLDFYRLMFASSEYHFMEQFNAALAPLMADIPADTLASGLNYLLHTDLRDILAQIMIPCDIIHGTEDEICPLSAARYLASHLPKGNLHLLDGAGHIPFFTRAQEFQALLKECAASD